LNYFFDFFFFKLFSIASAWYEKEAGSIDSIVLLKRCVKCFECGRLRRAAEGMTSKYQKKKRKKIRKKNT